MRIRLYFVVILALAIFSAESGSAWAKEIVSLKTFQGTTFSRLVFQWQETVSYQARMGEGILVIEFDRPLQADLASLAGKLPAVVLAASLGSDNRTVTIGLRDNLSVRSVASDGSVIFEFRSDSGSFALEQTKPLAGSKLQGDSSGPLVRIRVGEHEAYTRVVFDWPGVVGYRMEKTGVSVTVDFDDRATFSVPAALAGGKLDLITAVVEKAGDKTSNFVFTTSEGTDLRHFRNKASVVMDILRNADTPTVSTKAQAAPNASPASGEQTEIEESSGEGVIESVAEAAGAEEGGGPAKAVEFSSEKPGALNVALFSIDDGLSATFEWQAPTPAAVFERAGFHWVIFEGKGPVEIGPVGPDLAEDVLLVERVAVMRGTALRMRVRDGLFPHVGRRGATWKVDFRESSTPPNRPLLVRRQPDWPTGPRILIPLVGGASGRMAVSDPEVGDDIAVVPILEDGRGRADDSSFAQFRLLKSAQGVAVERWSDDIRVVAAPYGVEISAPTLGLALSGDPNKPARVVADPADNEETILPTLMPLAEWRKGTDEENLDEKRKELELLASQAKPDERSSAYLEVARFFVGHGLGAEALGYLRLAADLDPSLNEDLEFQALRGAGSLIMGRIGEAADDLLRDEYGVDPSVALWRGVVFAEQGEWDSARQEFLVGAIALPELPPVLRVQFQLVSANTAFEAGELAAAEVEIEMFDPVGSVPADVSRAKFIIGKVRVGMGDRDGGLALLDEVITEAYRPVWAEAQVVHTKTLLKAGDVEPRQAIDQLERLLFVWRGGNFELSLLQDLNKLYLETGDYRGAMTTLRTIKTSFEGTDAALSAEGDLKALFLRLYRDGDADQLPPVTALALYNDFSDLTPDGKEGDIVINKLADRLVSVDLLDRAAQLLKFQVSFRLRDLEKARVGARLAAVYLLDRQTDKAIEILEESKFRPVPPELLSERRYIKARTLIETEKYQEVMSLLENDGSKQSQALIAEVHWRQDNWVEAAVGLESVLGDRWKSDRELTAIERHQVMQLTVALALLNERERLDELRERWGSLMEMSSDGHSFSILTSNPDVSSVDFRKVAAQIAQTNTLDAFLDRYRSNN